MPHISVKMLKGRTKEQKQKLAEALQDCITQSLGCSKNSVSVAVEDYTAMDWQDIFKQEITDKKDKILIEPGYDPRSLL